MIRNKKSKMLQGTFQYLQGNGASVWQIERQKIGQALLTLTFEKVVVLF